MSITSSGNLGGNFSFSEFIVLMCKMGKQKQKHALGWVIDRSEKKVYIKHQGEKGIFHKHPWRV